MDIIAYLIHRRSKEGALDSLFSASARDNVFFENMKNEARKPPKNGTGDSQLDTFNDFLSSE